MIIGRLVVDVVVHLVGDAVVADICQDINVITTDTFVYCGLGFSASKSVERVVNFVRILNITVKSRIRLRHLVKIVPELSDVFINAFSKRLGRFHYYKIKWCYWD